MRVRLSRLGLADRELPAEGFVASHSNFAQVSGDSGGLGRQLELDRSSAHRQDQEPYIHTYAPMTGGDDCPRS